MMPKVLFFSLSFFLIGCCSDTSRVGSTQVDNSFTVNNLNVANLMDIGKLCLYTINNDSLEVLNHKNGQAKRINFLSIDLDLADITIKGDTAILLFEKYLDGNKVSSKPPINGEVVIKKEKVIAFGMHGHYIYIGANPGICEALKGMNAALIQAIEQQPNSINNWLKQQKGIKDRFIYSCGCSEE